MTLEDQNRSRWDGGEIAGARRCWTAPCAVAGLGPYQVQAAIAACHATERNAADTDWAQIAARYGQLARLTSSPVVALNQAVADDGVPEPLQFV